MPLEGHILACKWPMRGHNFKVSILLHGCQNTGFFCQGFSKIDLLEATSWPQNDLDS